MYSSKCTLTIDTQIIRENYQFLRSKCKDSIVSAALKANAYGLGVEKVASILQKIGCNDFFVASCDEGIELRRILGPKHNIYILYGVFKEEVQEFVQYNLIPVLNHLKQIELWQDYSLKIHKKLPCVLHFNTGMNRLGMAYSEIKIFDIDQYANNLNILYIMSHLSSAEEVNNPSSAKQLSLFHEYTEKFKGIKRSLANSSGVFLGEEYHFDLVRPGCAIYGINPAPYLADTAIKNPVKLSSPIIQLSILEPNNSVGYNETYTNNSKQACPIAIVPLGYADGLARNFSNKAVFYINDIPTPIIGNVSMDLTIIDVSKVPQKDLYLGQEVEIIGKNCTIDKLAQILKTNKYEILTMLGKRYKRIYN